MNNEIARTIIVVREKDGLAAALGVLFPLDANVPAPLAGVLPRLADGSRKAARSSFNHDQKEPQS